MAETVIPIPFPRLVDNTMMSAADACEMKFFNEFVRCLSPLAISPDLHAGGAFSKGIEMVRRGLYKDALHIREALPLGIRAIMEFWGDFAPPTGHPKTCEAMMGALDDYFREYPPESDPYRPHMLSNGEPAVEFTFAIPTDVTHPETGDPILYAGRSDMIASYDGQFLCVMDEKTTKALGQNWSKSWGMRGQFIGYCYGAQHYGYNISRAVVRGIAILKTKYNHIQVIEEYPQWQIDRWWATMNKKLARLVQRWEEQDWNHSYGDACTSYGGCPFMPLCVVETPENDFSSYQRRVWNPLEKDPTWPKGGPEFETVGNVKELLP